MVTLSPAEIAIIGLASWRLANLLVLEAGPFDCFERLRLFIGLKPGPVTGFFPLLFSCTLCMSFWTTIFVYFIFIIFPIAVMITAGWSVAVIIDSYVNRSS